MKAPSSTLSAESGTTGERNTLSPEVSHLLVQFSIALHRTVTYPPSHPTLEAAISALTLRLHRLLADRPIVSVGVARECLLVDGALTDRRNDVLRTLAESLHRHQIGAIRFHHGVAPAEVSAVLAGLATDPRQVGPLGLRVSESRDRWPSIHLESAAFDDLELDDCGTRAARAERAWLALAAAALLRDPEDQSVEDAEASEIAEAIRGRVRDSAYATTIARYMAQVGGELADLRGAGPHVARQMGDLVSALGDDTLAVLLEVGADLESRSRMARDLAGVLPARSAIALTRAASLASSRAISHALLRLFTKMAVNAESRTGTMSSAADAALRDSLRGMVDGWTLSDPNPERYRELLRYLTRSGRTDQDAGESDVSADSLRLVELAVEAGTVGDTVWRAIDELLQDNRLDQILDRLDAAPGEATAKPLREYLVQADRLRVILDGRQPREAVDRLLQAAGVGVADVLLDSLCSADSRATRRQIIARLQAMGDAIVEQILARLEQGPWYVQRNMLYLISQMERIPADLDVGAWLEHGDVRVRHEAIRVGLRSVVWRSRAMEVGLADTDSRTVSLVLGTAAEDCPNDVVPAVIRLLDSSSLDGTLRVLAVRALGQTTSDVARPRLMRLASTRRRWWWPRSLAPKSPELLAALAALAARWPTNPESAAILRMAARSQDPEVRAAASRPGRAA